VFPSPEIRNPCLNHASVCELVSDNGDAFDFSFLCSLGCKTRPRKLPSIIIDELFMDRSQEVK
jgi:hypothetical protein